MRLCIVSPHLDDAVLSCGIAMQRAKAAGGQAVVINIFSAGSGSDVRQANDVQAVEMLGGRSVFLDELDAPDRDARYKAEREIFYGDFSAVSADYIAHVAARLSHVIDKEKPDLVLFPLGVGTHVDHLVAFEASKHMGGNISYYEDRPYVLWPGMLQARLNMLGCDGGLSPVSADDMAASHGDYHFLHGDGKFPRDMPPERLMPPAQTALRGICEGHEATADELSRLYDSLACYVSQMPFIYPSREAFLHDSYAHEKTRSGQHAYIERSWSLMPV